MPHLARPDRVAERGVVHKARYQKQPSRRVRTALVFQQPLGLDEHRRSEADNPLNEIPQGVRHYVLGAVSKRDHGVGGDLRALDQVRIDRNVSSIEPFERDHHLLP